MQGYIYFLIPLRAHELGAGYQTIGLIAAAGTLAPGLLAVTLGALIDRIGPKRGFILGASAITAVSLVALLVTNYWWFLALQPFLGLSQTFGWLSSQGHITSLGTPAQRPMLTGRFSFFVNVGQMASPVLAGAVAQAIGLRWAFLVPAAYAAFFVALGFALIDTRPDAGPKSRTAKSGGLRSAIQLTTLRGIQVALLLTFARLWIATVFNTFVPVYLVGKGFSTGLAGTVVATASLVAAVMAPTTGYWTRRMCNERATMLGLGCGALSLLLVPHIAVVPVIYIAPILWGIALGTSLPLLISIVTSAAPADQRGVALGLRVSANKAAATGAPVLVGPLIAALGMALGFTVGGALALALLAGSRLLLRADRRAPARLAEAGVTPQ
jgi:MFS family permease